MGHMSGRIIAGAVLLLLVVVGGIFLLIGTLEGGDSDTGSLGGARTTPVLVAQR